jgi:hypothetical protein
MVYTQGPLTCTVCSYWTPINLYEYIPVYSKNHGGILRTMHCRLCINCYGTSYWEAVLRIRDGYPES